MIPMTIHEWLEDLRDLDQREYYALLLEVRETVQSCLDCAEGDGIDLSDLEPADTTA